MGTVKTVQRNYSYRWGLSKLSSEIIATDGDCQNCLAKLWLQMGTVKIV